MRLIGDNSERNFFGQPLFVAYSAWAEMTCFMMLGWQFPVYIFDLHSAYLAATNILLPYNPDEKRTKQRKRLSDACRAYGIPGWENIDKEEIAKAIGEGRWHEYGQAVVFDYCEEDVRKSVELLRAVALSLWHLRPHLVTGRRRRAGPALVELQCEDGRADPGARYAG